MPNLNRCEVMGHLGRGAEATMTAGGFPIVRFSVAATSRVKKAGEWTDETEWFKVVAIGERYEKMAERLVKGVAVYVEGRLQTRSWDDTKDGQKRYMTELVANDVKVLDGRTGNSSRTAPVRDERPSNQPLVDKDTDPVPF
jgi:single-strand DNA-binding protein